MKKWLDVEFESACYKTQQFRSFATQFRNAIKKALPENAKTVKLNTGHFYVSGFIEREGKFVYFSVSDVRYFANEWYNHILIRTAKSERDFTGGFNEYTTLEKFGSNVDLLLND